MYPIWSWLAALSLALQDHACLCCMLLLVSPYMLVLMYML